MIAKDSSTKAATSQMTADSFFKDILAHHTVTNEPAAVGTEQLKALEILLNALEERSPNSPLIERQEQARALLEIRLTNRISTEQLAQAIRDGSSVDEIVRYTNVVSRLAKQPESDEEAQRDSTLQITPYQFKVVSGERSSRFGNWLKSLDSGLKQSVMSKLNRITEDSIKRLKPLEAHSQLFEVRIHDGPGLRVYVGLIKGDYALLIGGKKDDQLQDILKAAKVVRDIQSPESQFRLAEFNKLTST